MSTANIRRIAENTAAKIAAATADAAAGRLPDVMKILTEHVTALARDSAEAVFLKVQTELGWTQESAQEFVDTVFHEHLLAITDSIHANGGSIDLAQDLVKVASIAYGARLAELTASYNHGGAS